MKIMSSLCEMRDWSRENAQRNVGFVPTMGALHAGHLALARRAREENEICVASIFVNPTQFAPSEDFSTYARPFQRDCELLREIGCDVVFAPTIDELYPHLAPRAASEATSSTRSSEKHPLHGPQTVVEVQRLGEVWEGTVRPGHLRGVATVVTMLFNVVQPTRAYFGEKDYQQLKVVEHLARDLCMNIEIVACETIRESDGLALSSRNANLSDEERRAAPAIFRGMEKAVAAAHNGERDVMKLVEIVCQEIAREPLFTVQYIAIVDAETLNSIPQLDGRAARVLVAAKIGKTRLIDNCAILCKDEG